MPDNIVTEVQKMKPPRSRKAQGLSAAEVAERVADGRVNVSTRNRRSTKGIILAHTLTYFNLLNIVLGALILATGQFKNILFLGTMISNTVIGIVQELRVRSMIDKLSVITAQTVVVLRDGKKSRIPVEEVVEDDVLYLKTGDQIIADGPVLASRYLEVNESMLTGESKAVKKDVGDELLSGSFIVAGKAVMRAEKVGEACYASDIVKKASSRRRATSEMQNTIGNIIKVVSFVIIPVGLLLFRSQYAVSDADFGTTVVRSVSGIIGMIPEGLVLLTSVSFIIGVGRLAQKKALVQEMEAIEALARVNVLCTDKTGTITTGELTVSRIVPFKPSTADDLISITGHLNAASAAENATQAALNSYFHRISGWETGEIIPFSSDRKYSAVSFPGHGDYVIGAPELIVPESRQIKHLVDGYASDGYRVLLVGQSTGISAAEETIGTIRPLGLIVLSDVIKTDAREMFRFFAESGVAVKVLSGDNPQTVSTVAKKAGIPGAEHYIDASELPENPIALAQVIDQYTVFGRVRPEQKQAFVRAWQTNKKTVAMVGDGVNDVLAIKDADCGIAMANGSEAAKQAAHVVLLDSNFSSMRDIVSEGKTIIANIERVSSLYLTKTIYATLLVLLSILLSQTYPFTTLQMGLINLCGIGLPSFLLTMEHKEDLNADGFLKHVLEVCVPSALTFVTTMLIIQLLGALLPWSEDILSTFHMMLGGLVSMLVVANVCWPLNRYRKAVLGISVGVFVFLLVALPRFYDMHSIFMWQSLLLIPLMVLTLILIVGYSRLTKRVLAHLSKSLENARRRTLLPRLR